MSELGELLELLHSARRSFRTARGTLHHRQSSRVVREAMQREVERGRATAYGPSVRREGEEPPDLYEERLRFWWEPPDRLREEVEYVTRGSRATTVRDGELWWRYTPEHGAVSNVDLDPEERARHGGGGSERFRPLLDPSEQLAVLEFEEIARKDDRLLVRARPRAEAGRMRYGGADALELEVDSATGVLRRVTSYFEGQELASTELVELALDEELPDETFVFVPPAGEEVQPPESARHPARYTLEEAVAEAPFTVFHVPELPEGNWRLHVLYHPARRRPPTGATLGLHYSRADGRGSLVLVQQAAGDGLPGFPWTGARPEIERVGRDGIRYTVARANAKQGGVNRVAFERDGTALRLESSHLSAETLLDLASTLQPVG